MLRRQRAASHQGRRQAPGESIMIRNNLFLTTALVVVGSLSTLAIPSAVAARPFAIGPSRDSNEEFLCAYGAFPVSAHYIGSASSYSSTWTRAAVAIIGRGRTVTSITVKEAPSASTSRAQFSAGIYSNTASGPGKLLSGGTGKARTSCGKVTVQIKPIKLMRNTTYWVEERVQKGVSDQKNEVYWASDPKTKLRSYVQTHNAYNYYGNSSSYTSPWTAQSAGPYVRVK